MPTEAERPPEQSAADFYEILQVSPRAEQEVIEAAYKRLALKYHPDLNNTPEATRRMQELNQAYTVLSNAERRAEYDREHYPRQAKQARYVRRRKPARPKPAQAEQAETTVTSEASSDTSAETPPPEASDFAADSAAEPEVEAEYADWDETAANHAKNREWNYVAEKPRSGKTLIVIAGLIALMLLVFGLFNLYGPLFGAGADNSPAQVKEVLPPNVLFDDDFDTVLGANWLLDSPWHLTSSRAASGGYSLWIGEEGKNSYRPGLDASATLARPVSLANPQNPLIRFRLSGQFGNENRLNGQDKLMVEVAEPGRDFETVYKAQGNFPNWQDTLVDLSKWKNKTVLIRFRFTSAPGAVLPGATGPFIDDVRIER